MKRKLGPLPVWAWALLAGGTIGIVLYLRSRSTTSSSPTPADGALPATAGAPPDAGATDGSSGLTAPSPLTGATPDDIMAELQGLSAQLATIPGGGQGLTDGNADTPVVSWSGEVSDVAAGIGALQTTFPGIFASPQASTSKPAASASGGGLIERRSAAHGGALWDFRRAASGRLIPVRPAEKPVRHTTKHVAGKAGGSRTTDEKPVHVTAGGNSQEHRVTPPPAKHKPKPKPKKRH